MTFRPGKSGNPLGRPRRFDVLSEQYKTFCVDHAEDIKKAGEIVFEEGIINRQPWALKLCLEYFVPKPERNVSLTKEEIKDTRLTLEIPPELGESLSFEEKQTYLKLWYKSKRGVPAFASTDSSIIEPDDNDGTEEGSRRFPEDCTVK